MKLGFLGAAREVTGSCYLFETDEVRFLVDCGMEQGGRDAPLRNRKSFDFDPRDIDFVLLTPAHIDHSGLLPKLVLNGFTGLVYTTHATADLLAIMLPDSGHIQEMEAERAARRPRPDAHAPIYTVEGAKNCLQQIFGGPAGQRTRKVMIEPKNVRTTSRAYLATAGLVEP